VTSEYILVMALDLHVEERALGQATFAASKTKELKIMDLLSLINQNSLRLW
jgi:hypothetical protein